MNRKNSFKKGDPGGPGRPKGSKNFAAILAYLLDAPTGVLTPEGDSVVRKYVMCVKQIEQAEKGDTKAFKAITEIMEGRPGGAKLINMPGGMITVTNIDKQVLAQHGFEVRENSRIIDN